MTGTPGHRRTRTAPAQFRPFSPYALELEAPGTLAIPGALLWLRGLDLNQRPLGYEPNELPDCSTPRCHRLPYLTAPALSSVTRDTRSQMRLASDRRSAPSITRSVFAGWKRP